MIIDVHAHIGVVPGSFHMPLENQLYGMEKYGIDYALISDIRCGESQTKEKDGIAYQTLINAEAAKIVRSHKDRLGLMLWCRPNAEEGFTSAFEQLYLDNKDIVKGLKVHPDISGVAFHSQKLTPYLEMADRYSLPVLIHTQDTDNSKVEYVCQMAEKYPDVAFILGHMNLSGTKDIAIRAMQEHPNIYGDTAWVYYADVVRACDLGLEDRLLFGTDSPIGGKDTYGDPSFYTDYYSNPSLPREVMDKIMHRNAQKLFRL